MAARTLKADPQALPRDVLAIWDRLEAQRPSFLVGGAVRDLMLGREPKDYDIATQLPPPEVLRLLVLKEQRGGRFGSIRVPGLPLEIVSTREEAAYRDRRRPSEVRFGAAIERDLRRRDFTINAMAMDRAGRLIDPQDGRRDLARGLLRCVGRAEQRLSEDLLRIVRAYRFAAQLGLRLAPSVRRAARSLAGDLGQIAPERLGQEMLLLMAAPGGLAALRRMRADGVLREILSAARIPGRDYPNRLLRLCALSIGQDPATLERDLRRIGWPEDERREAVRVAQLSRAVLQSTERPVWRQALAEAGPRAASLLTQVGGREFAAFSRLYGREGIIDRTRLRLRGAQLAQVEGLRPEEIGPRERELLAELWQRPRI